MKYLYNLMIVAHPDDESLFGGSLLITESNWKVVCVSCGYQEWRRADFERAMKFINITDYEIWNFPDNLPDAIPAWTDEITLKISNRIKKVLNEKKYDMIVTHGLDGEYGHNQHKAVHQIVKNLVTENLFVFGKSDERLGKEVLMKKIELLDMYDYKKLGTQHIWNLDSYIPWIINEEIICYE